MGQLFKMSKLDFILSVKAIGVFCLIGIFAEKLFRYSCSVTLGYFITLTILGIFSKVKGMNKNEGSTSIYFCKIINTALLFTAIVDIAYIYILFSFHKYQSLNMIFNYQWKIFIFGILIALIPFYNIYIKKEIGITDIFNSTKHSINKYENIFNNAKESNNNTDYNKSVNKNTQAKSTKNTQQNTQNDNRNNNTNRNNNHNRKNNTQENTQENSRTNRDVQL